MEQQIQFCTSADGTRIAYATYGDTVARPLVVVNAFENAQEHSSKSPGILALHEGLAVDRRIVTFDRRGVGGSQRDVDDLAIPTQVADLAAVIDELELDSFDLTGVANGGVVATAYAAEHPERVGRLVLWHPLVGTLDAPLRGLEAFEKTIRADWSLARRSWASIAYPTGPAEAQRWFANMLRDSIAPETAARHFEVMAGFDGTTILGKIEAPTLVLANSDTRGSEIASIRRIASLIPDARLITIEGGWSTADADTGQLASAIRKFLDELATIPEAGLPGVSAPGLVTILFTDMEGSTSLTQRLGDAKAQDVLHTHNSIVRDALTTHSGTEIKHTGDGIMASFTSASAALEAAVAIQKALADHNEANPDTAIRVRIGLNAGEPVAEDEDLFGTAVQLAARVCDKAKPGQIVASNVVQELAAGKGFDFADQGEVDLKGFEKPVRLHEVRWHD